MPELQSSQRQFVDKKPRKTNIKTRETHTLSKVLTWTLRQQSTVKIKVKQSQHLHSWTHGKGLTNSAVSVEHFVNCLWATTKNYFHWNLELWRDSQRIPSFFFVATENLELCNNEQRHFFYFESSASVIFSASGLDVGLGETSFYTQDLQ